MDRDEWGIGYKIAIWREECTREVEPLFDVRTYGRLLQRFTHCLRYAHEAVSKECEEDRIGSGLVRHNEVSLVLTEGQLCLDLRAFSSSSYCHSEIR